jgi:exonuclease SbcC
MEKAARELEQAEREFARQNEIWEDRRGEAGFASEQDFLAACLEPREKQRRRERTAAFRSDWKVAESALKDQLLAVEGKPLQDIQALQQALNQAEQTRKALVQHQILLDSGLNTLRADEKSLALRIERNRDALIALEADQVFARRLSGVHGVSLQRYVLGVMMNSITAQANRLLQNVYGGRYKLYRTDETTGRTLKGGLELEVFDSQNSQRRSVRTLSGGEKFLVALSLAIGLSTVVQAQGEGIRLEAMFIDEGFGSLDREAIQDALEILQGIRRTAGVVGIISHVEALAETIPARIEITKGKRGSSAKILGI